MHEKNKILFIDDEKICHTLVEIIIENFTNYTLLGAYNGAEAIDLATKHARHLALIVSDILLPDINGYYLYQKLKLDDKLKDIPFIFQSGLFNQETELKKYTAKNVQILYKPYKREDLLMAIEKELMPRE